MAIYENIQGTGSTIAEAKRALVARLTEIGIKPLVISRIVTNNWQRLDNADGTFTAIPTGGNFIRHEL